MQRNHLQFLVCPGCKSDLELNAVESHGGDVESGELKCPRCGSVYPIIRHIPRFAPQENYTSNFGLEWLKHARTQYDSHSGIKLSEERFFNETGWPRDLAGQLVLEVGCGSGRFTEQAASTGAMVVSLDYSCAVEANYASHGERDNVLIVQGDIYNMPFRKESFDKCFCFGVLQHTPDVRKSFLTLPHYLKHGGELAIDVYRKASGIRRLLNTKYWFRPITRRMNPRLLYAITSAYVRFMWPVCGIIHKTLPRAEFITNKVLMVADYRDHPCIGKLKEDVLMEWAILDTFDWFSPAYDYPQTIETVRGWCEEAKLTNIDVHYDNGIECRARKP